MEMLKRGICSPLGELFYNKLPAGVRKPSPAAFCSQRKSQGGFLSGSLCRDVVTHPRPLCTGSSIDLKPPLFCSPCFPPTLPTPYSEFRAPWGGGEPGEGEGEGKGESAVPRSR